MSLKIELLRRVQAHILAHPEQVDMNTYGDRGTGCIAFHACKLSGEPIGSASRLLEVYDCDASRLFVPDDKSGFYDNPGTPEHAQRVSDHIDRFIAEHGGAA